MKKLVYPLLLLAFAMSVEAQNKYTKEQVLSMTEDQLMDLSMEDFSEAIKAVGVSNPDELFALIMNKNVSSASKEEEDSFRSPLSTTVITRQEMRTYGITTIEEAFRLIPGMIVTEKYNGIYDIQMRGLNNIPDNNTFLYTENANTLLMIDGRPVQNNVMGSINFDMLPIGIEDIDRIEVVRGACSAVYGANAVNGVINIITERPSVTSYRVSGNVHAGNYNTFISEIALRKALNSKIAIGATANIQRRDRITDKLYLIPNPDQYIPTDATGYIPAAGSKITMDEALAYKDIVIDASNGGEFTLEQVQSMRQLYDDTTPGVMRLFDGTEPETPLNSMFPDPQMSRETFGANGYLCLTPTDDVNIFFSGGYQKSHVNGSPCNEDIVAMNGRKSSTGYVNLDANIKSLRLVANYMGGVQEYIVGVPGYKMRVNNVNSSLEYDWNLDCGLMIRPGFFFQHTCADDYVPVWNDDDPINAAIADEAAKQTFGIDLTEPGFRANYKWHYEDPGSGFEKGYNYLTGLFTGEKEISTIAPSLRMDYKYKGLRTIAAFRMDKTTNPDKWSKSWQFGASYLINEDNFVRFVYGRANRGSNLVNSCADYTWLRTNMFYPYKLRIGGNEDIDLMHIDNFEVGYRWRPTKRILIDAEAFLSKSTDYGSMMADYGAMQVSADRLNHIIYGIYLAVQQMPDGINGTMFSNPQLTHYMANYIFMSMAKDADMKDVVHPYANVMYQMLPYEVTQMGISMNGDFIISPKLIAKVNLNVQKTTIDNYYKYKQIDDIKSVLTLAAGDAIQYNTPQLDEMTSMMMDRFVTDPQMNYIMKNYDLTGQIPKIHEEMLNGWRENSQKGMEDKEALRTAAWVILDRLYNQNNLVCEFGRTDINRGQAPEGERTTIYKSEADGTEYYIVNGDVSNVYTTNPTSNGYEHKATPKFYGMLGLIYKPIEKLEISGFCNIIGKRTYNLAYGSFDLDTRCTLNLKVGYKPIEQFEVFFNGHNLFNDKQREFVMTDRIGGLYTVGVTFGL